MVEKFCKRVAKVAAQLVEQMLPIPEICSSYPNIGKNYLPIKNKKCLRSDGLVVRAVACEARGPGFDSSSDQKGFFSPRVYGGRYKMDPDMVNCMILRSHVEK